LEREAGPQEASGKLIIAHLGNGASMTAIEDGRSLDTTMGLTPAGGLVMSNRSGDLDPGVMLYLLQEKGMTPAAVNHLINHQAGLLGISGISSDMQDLLAQENTEAGAALAVELFCYQARKFLGALAGVLGGLTRWSLPEASVKTLPSSGPESVRIWNSLAFIWTWN
jgi:acetate kinase